jgi:hypothetical protein
VLVRGKTIKIDFRARRDRGRALLGITGQALYAITMALDEKLAISVKACKLYQAGDIEGFATRGKAEEGRISYETGIDSIEKALLKQRFANLYTAQNGYVEKQKKAMGNEF